LNPSIAAFDHGKAPVYVHKGKYTKTMEGFPTVTRQFIEEQMAAMRTGMSEEAAYAATRGWLLDNGPRLFQQLSLPNNVKRIAMQTPVSLGASRVVKENALAGQVERLRRLLAREREKDEQLLDSSGLAVVRPEIAEKRKAVQLRTRSKELELPRRTPQAHVA